MDWKNLTVEYIEWWDSEANSGWEPLKDADKQEVVQSVGYVMSEGKGFLTLALNISPSVQEVNCQITIPKVCIKRRVKLCQIQSYAIMMQSNITSRSRKTKQP